MSLATFLLFAQLANPLTIAPKDWKYVPEQSGPVNYYAVVTEGGESFLRSKYVPPYKTSIVAWKTPEEDRKRITKVRWTWRAQKLPVGGDECASGKQDSGAVVYFLWKRFLKYYTLKYVWSAASTVGKTCDRKRSPFLAQETVILQSGGALSTWKTEEIDLASEFRRHFEGGDATAEVPNFAGIGLMSDGDQTQTESSADFGAFTLYH